jgi:hypothetical protein
LLLHLVETLQHHSGQAAVLVLNTLAALPDREVADAARSALEEDAPS